MISMASTTREYNVPLRQKFQTVPKYRRSKKAVTTMRDFIRRHMKSDDIKLSPNINMAIWERGIKYPPHHVKVIARKNDAGVVFVELAGKSIDEYEKSFAKDEKKEAKKTPVQERVDKLKQKLGAGKEAAAGKEEAAEDKEAPLPAEAEKPAPLKAEQVKPAATAPAPKPAAPAKPAAPQVAQAKKPSAPVKPKAGAASKIKK